MRLPVLPLLLAGASVGKLFGRRSPSHTLSYSFLCTVGLVAAEPIRVIDTANANIRFGHALANANVNGNDDHVARIVRPMTPIDSDPPSQGKGKGLTRHLCGASLREKALRLSNAFRHALGLPLIEADREVTRVHILPVGYPNVIVQEELDEEGKPKNHHEQEHPDGHHGHHRVHGHHGHHHKHHHKTFLNRIHRAIKALGPWEGRAVAFVLGEKY